jgi:hypothetical protein
MPENSPIRRATRQIRWPVIFLEEVLVRYPAEPELAWEDINACFAFAADRERKLFVAPA